LITGTLDKDYRVSPTQDPLANFELADEKGVFVPAHAKIEGRQVVVWNEAVKQPMAVRHAWAPNPDPPVNLYNLDGLPAAPFKIDIQTTLGRK
jgi:sialate O-acetylesterase